MSECIVTNDLNQYLSRIDAADDFEQTLIAASDSMIEQLLSGGDAYVELYTDSNEYPSHDFTVEQGDFIAELFSSYADEVGELLPKLIKGEEMGKLSNELEVIMKACAKELVDAELGL